MIRPAEGPTVLLAGGGTGGHLFPGLAVAESLIRRRPGARVLLAATRRDREAPHGAAPHGASCPVEMVYVRSPRRPRGPLGTPTFGWRMTAAVGRSLRLLRKESPDVVVGLGGYGSVAPVVAARMRRIPVILLEQNAVPGRATRFLSRVGTVTAASFPGLGRLGVRGRVVETGNPLRRLLENPSPAHEHFGLRPGVPTLAVVGGSLGARGLNRKFIASLQAILAAVAPRNGDGAGFQVLHATGAGDPPEPYRAAYRRAGVTACVRTFFHEMDAVYGTADVMLCRAGGTTVAELAAVGLPAVFVPYPHHRDGHQRENARALVETGAATLVEEEAMTPERVAAELAPLLGDASLLEQRARAARRTGRRDAAERVVDLVLSLSRCDPADVPEGTLTT